MRFTTIESAEKWRSAVLKFGNFDSYHTWDFTCIDADRSGVKCFALLLEDGERMLFLPVIERRIPHQRFLKDLTSAYGYPGPLYVGPASDFSRLWAYMVSELRQMGYVSLFSRCSPFSQLVESHLHADFRYCGSVVAIDLSLSDDQQWRQYRVNHRRDIRHAAQKGLECEQGGVEDVGVFLTLYRETMDRLGAGASYYFDESYVIAMLTATDFDCRLYRCKLGQHTVAAGLFIFGNGMVHYHLSGSDLHFSELRATKLMIDTVRRRGAKEGYSLFNLGGGLGGERDQLYHFKRGFSNTECAFYVVKSILNADLYRALCCPQAGDPKETNLFFPAYRLTGTGS